MANDAAIHLPKDLSAALAAEAERAGVSVEALAEEAIARHLDALKTLEHFVGLRANADWGLLDRVLSREGGEPPPKEDRLPERRS